MSVERIIDKILAANHASDIFDKNEDIKKAYHSYIKLIHPDVCSDPRAEKAFILLKSYYEYALANPGKINDLYYMAGSKILITKALDIQAFELGARYVCNNEVVYIFDAGKEKYYENVKKQTSRIFKTFSDHKSIEVYIPVMPRIGDHGKTESGRYILGMDKESNEYPFDLFLKAYQNSLTGKDIAWMISRMIELCCFLHCNGYPTALNGFTEKNLFINPDQHSIHIYGGWWYATPIGEKMIGTSKDVYSCMSTRTKTDHISDPLTDIESVRAIARRIITGNSDIQKYMLDWINAGSLDNPIEEKMRWDDVLERCYGPRKFIKFEYDPNKIYQKGV